MNKFCRRSVLVLLGIAFPLGMSSLSYASPANSPEGSESETGSSVEVSDPNGSSDQLFDPSAELSKSGNNDLSTNAEESKQGNANSSASPYVLEPATTEPGMHGKSEINKVSVKFKAPEKIYNLSLYDEFVDETAAWNLMLRDYQPEIAWLQKDAKLPPLSKSTVNEWVEASDASLINADPSLNMSELNWYLFGFKAHSCNQEIVRNLEKAVAGLNQGIPREENSALDEANSLLSLEGDNNLFDAAYGMHAPELETRAAFNVKAATAYATKWRNQANPGYKEFQYDCANFASQIMRAGGRAMTKGWFYHSRNNYRKNISKSWRIANNFAKYWGLTKRTTSLATFASRLHPGSFIGISNTRGDVSHIGYVHIVSNRRSKYNHVTYRVFGVTQHTQNYAGWAEPGKKAQRWLQQKGWVTQ